MGDLINSLLSSPSFVIVIGTVMVIAFAKSIIKIFRMGVTFKTDVVTRAELKEFEESIRQDMRGYAVQIQKLVTNSSTMVINDKMKDLDDVKKTSTDMRIMKNQIEADVKAISEKCNEINALMAEVRSLSNRVQRLEYNSQQTSINSNERRSV